MDSSNNKKNENVEMGTDWAKNAEDAAKRAEDQVSELKKEAQQQLKGSKSSYNNPTDKK
ncbi:hypothetical protein JSQ81_08445 [Sporosarcina sp. Marseille-Q4063]|uniref:hypothetical protein n=1 Tax=Sporosarcina sp. Marseille-Q4063 TaxID=2810514 RepID=UPI001BB07A78|nr:hypothetical protein [Sporosarcina sp. Marseille-Q4063]QUW23514.1 hypothetical protein JSQ81_08445 [Sporosarcina sp. Marseille-Q4063]